jgi:hypothetical protein
MAEEAENGRIKISKNELNSAIEVTTFNFIQVPTFPKDSFARVYVSKHGDMNKTWVGLTQETCMSIEPPFYVYSKLPCIIPALEL